MFSEDEDIEEAEDLHTHSDDGKGDGTKRSTGGTGSGRRSADRHELTVTASINANNPQVGQQPPLLSLLSPQYHLIAPCMLPDQPISLSPCLPTNQGAVLWGVRTNRTSRGVLHLGALVVSLPGSLFEQTTTPTPTPSFLSFLRLTYRNDATSTSLLKSIYYS